MQPVEFTPLRPKSNNQFYLVVLFFTIKKSCRSHFKPFMRTH